MNPVKELRSLPSKVQALRAGLEDLIKNLPQNQDATPVGSGSAFTVKLSDLSKDKILSPVYYDFKAQHKLFLNVIQLTPIDKLDTKMKGILDTGYIAGVKINPQVLEAVRQIWLSEPN